MKRTLPLFLICTLATAVAPAQETAGYRHHNFDVGIGPAIPVGTAANYLSTAPLFGFGYGYRFNKYFRADAGLQIAWGAASNQNAAITEIGPVQGGDHEFMVPLGGRFIVPTPFRRFEISAGGGAAYLHYSETIPNNGFVSLSCFNCTSRGGWGGYGLGNVSYFLDSNRNFHVGTTVQFISARTNGQAVGNVPANSTTDHWMNVLFEFGLSF